jgi:hypothetical protein
MNKKLTQKQIDAAIVESQQLMDDIAASVEVMFDAVVNPREVKAVLTMLRALRYELYGCDLNGNS